MELTGQGCSKMEHQTTCRPTQFLLPYSRVCIRLLGLQALPAKHFHFGPGAMRDASGTASINAPRHEHRNKPLTKPHNQVSSFSAPLDVSAVNGLKPLINSPFTKVLPVFCPIEKSAGKEVPIKGEVGNMQKIWVDS